MRILSSTKMLPAVPLGVAMLVSLLNPKFQFRPLLTGGALPAGPPALVWPLSDELSRYLGL
jgi:hypothetical protein